MPFLEREKLLFCLDAGFSGIKERNNSSRARFLTGEYLTYQAIKAGLGEGENFTYILDDSWPAGLLRAFQHLALTEKNRIIDNFNLMEAFNQGLEEGFGQIINNFGLFEEQPLEQSLFSRVGAVIGDNLRKKIRAKSGHFFRGAIYKENVGKMLISIKDDWSRQERTSLYQQGKIEALKATALAFGLRIDGKGEEYPNPISLSEAILRFESLGLLIRAIIKEPNLAFCEGILAALEKAAKPLEVIYIGGVYYSRLELDSYWQRLANYNASKERLANLTF